MAFVAYYLHLELHIPPSTASYNSEDGSHLITNSHTSPRLALGNIHVAAVCDQDHGERIFLGQRPFQTSPFAKVGLRATFKKLIGLFMFGLCCALQISGFHVVALVV